MPYLHAVLQVPVPAALSVALDFALVVQETASQKPVKRSKESE